MSSTVPEIIFEGFVAAASHLQSWAGLGHHIAPGDVDGALRMRFTLCMFLAHSVPFFLMNFAYETVTRFVPMRVLSKWRFNGAAMPSDALMLRAVLVTTFYHLAAPLFVWFVGFDVVSRINPSVLAIDALPSLPVFLFQLVLCYVCTDATFYWGHRLLHDVPWLYANVHKIHHQFIYTVGWAAEYSHPIEWVFGNVLPVLAAPFVLRLHGVVWLSWMAVAMAGTTAAHSGFWYPELTPSGPFWHTFHHSHNVGNFGHSQLWDRLFHTDRAWVRFWRAPHPHPTAAAAVGGHNSEEVAAMAALSLALGKPSHGRRRASSTTKRARSSSAKQSKRK